jgi:predicted unusual protein kinase regulating ubiquinone biosynthesis (AarF/ABC1/UbiB family)
MSNVIAGYDRLAVPRVYGDLSSSRLLVMEEVRGAPLSEAPEGPARKEAARQLLESYYKQILVDGFFHADPHPGNLMWWNDRIYFLDFGMVGEVDPAVRQQLMLLLMAFWQEDVGFLTDVTLMLAGAIDRSELDVKGFTDEIGALVAKYRTASLQDIQLGPILQEMSEVALRYRVPLPASLTLTGKALAQMQLATAQLDPELDPFDVAGSFLMRTVLRGMGATLDPHALFYQSQRIKVRFLRVVEAIERLIGARPGQKLEVNFRAATLESTIRRAGRRLALGLTAGAALLATGLTLLSTRVPGWVPSVFGAAAAVLTVGLVVDLFRRNT